jgi:predicted lipid-binding transport protein (Tim44 family)/tellurite resistance protein/ribosomal protein L37E
MVRLWVIFLLGNGLDLLAGETVGLASSERFSLSVAIYVTVLVSVGVAFAKTLLHISPADAARQRERERKRKERALSLEEAVARIRARDPAFCPDAFLLRASQALRAYKRAWNQQDFVPVRPFVSDAVYERCCLQLAEKKRRGIHDVTEDWIVQERMIAQVDPGEHLQTITVRFRATAKVYREDAAGRLVSGHKFPQPVVEYCSFVRKPGAATRASGGLLEGNCPNCGTPLHLNETGICSSCGAKVWSGRYDWVLTEIIQEGEWRARPHIEVPGVAALSAADPAFCLQQLHDRANAMFWRRITAWQLGDVALLRNMATADYCQTLAAELVPNPDGTRRIPAEPVIGSVETEGILCESPFDQALVKINWSSGGECLFPDGRRQPVIHIGFRTSFFLLTRRHGAQGSLDDALSSSHCRGCGAPVTASYSALCQHCGIPLVDADRDWLLAAVYFENEPPVQALLSRFRKVVPTGRAPSSGRELVAWMIQVMVADGTVEAEERALLEAVAARHGVAASELELLIVAAQAGELELELPHNASTARDWLGTLAAMALADGKASEEEKKIMQALGRRLGLSKKKIREIISGARTHH